MAVGVGETLVDEALGGLVVAPEHGAGREVVEDVRKIGLELRLASALEHVLERAGCGRAVPHEGRRPDDDGRLEAGDGVADPLGGVSSVTAVLDRFGEPVEHEVDVGEGRKGARGLGPTR